MTGCHNNRGVLIWTYFTGSEYEANLKTILSLLHSTVFCPPQPAIALQLSFTKAGCTVQIFTLYGSEMWANVKNHLGEVVNKVGRVHSFAQPKSKVQNIQPAVSSFYRGADHPSHRLKCQISPAASLISCS